MKFGKMSLSVEVTVQPLFKISIPRLFTTKFGKEKLSALFSKNKVADESLPLLTSHFVFKRQRAEFFFSKKIDQVKAGQNNDKNLSLWTSHFVLRSQRATPPRTHRISGLKSQVLKSGLDFFYFEILLAPSEIPANLPGQFSLSGQNFLK